MKKKILTILLAILAVAAALAAGLYLGARQAPAPASTPAPAVTRIPTTTPERLALDPNAGALVTPTPAPTEPGVAIPGWGSITLPAGATEAQVALNNPEANDGFYYLTFELRLKETGEVLFTTGLIPPGQYCNKVTLTRALAPGEYAAVLHVQPYRMDENQSPTNNADMETALIVE